MTDAFAQLPPQDLEAEQAALAAALVESHAAEILATTATEDDFYREAHRHIFLALQGLQRRGEVVDLITVCSELRRAGRLEEVGGPEYLDCLIAGLPTAAHVHRYLGLLRRRSLLREIIRVTAAVQAQAYADPPDPQQLSQALLDHALRLNRAAAPPSCDLEQVRQRLAGIRWLWPGWLPRGCYTLLGGESGCGKSALALRIAASVAGGLPWPDGTPSGPPAPVLWLDTEGTQALLCDRSRRWELGEGFPERLRLPGDGLAEVRLDEPGQAQLTALAAAELGAPLVVVDSLSGAHRADENSSEVRNFLQELVGAARDHDLAFLLVHHLRKRALSDRGEGDLDRLRGSSAVAQFARVVWMLGKVEAGPSPAAGGAGSGESPEAVVGRGPGEGPGRLPLVLRVRKSNLAPFPAELGMAVDGRGVHFGPAPVRGRSPQRPPAPDKGPTALEQARDFLREALHDGPRPAKEVVEAAQGRGLAAWSVYRAAKLLPSVTVEGKRGRGGQRWTWSEDTPTSESKQ